MILGEGSIPIGGRNIREKSEYVEKYRKQLVTSHVAQKKKRGVGWVGDSNEEYVAS